jgi:rieske iron-sulfur protein
VAGGDNTRISRGTSDADATGRIDASRAEMRSYGVCDRRAILKIGLATGAMATMARGVVARAAEPKNMRPQDGDRFVYASGKMQGSEIKPDALAQGEPSVLAWPMDPETKIVRDGSRLNQVLLIRLDPASLNDTTSRRAADGIVAYSAVCTHAQCPVSGWNAEKKVLHCQCHQSEFDPRTEAKVTFGPAPRSLPALPVRIVNDTLMGAGTFLGKVGARTG